MGGFVGCCEDSDSQYFLCQNSPCIPMCPIHLTLIGALYLSVKIHLKKKKLIVLVNILMITINDQTGYEVSNNLKYYITCCVI